tara:strand:+ start:299 stop:580 length:282 start_codon:yes stop_codon:yes gene_type:complete
MGSNDDTSTRREDGAQPSDALREKDSETKDRTFWQGRSHNELSAEDSRECETNILGFFKVLLEWEAKDRAESEEADGLSLPHDIVDVGAADPE